MLPPHSEDQLYLAYRANVLGMLNVLEAVRLAGVSCLVFISSLAVYAPGTPMADDDFRQRPRSMYGTTKVCCERLGEQYNRRYGVNFRALRLPPVLGAGRAGEAPSLAITCRAIEAAVRLSPYTVNVKPETELAALYVKDAARALVGIRDASEDSLRQRVYNVQSFSTSAGDLVRAINKHIPEAQLDFSPDEKIVNFMNNLPQRLDDSAAHADWGWHASYDLEGAVADFIAELRTHPERYAQASG